MAQQSNGYPYRVQGGWSFANAGGGAAHDVATWAEALAILWAGDYAQRTWSIVELDAAGNPARGADGKELPAVATLHYNHPSLSNDPGVKYRGPAPGYQPRTTPHPVQVQPRTTPRPAQAHPQGHFLG